MASPADASSTPSKTVVGRTPWDAAVDVMALLGRAAPYLVVAAIAIYAFSEYTKVSDDRLDKITQARTAAASEYKQQIDDLNKRLRETTGELEKTRQGQLETLEKILGLNKTILESVVENQERIAQQRQQFFAKEDALRKAESEMRAAVAERDRLDEYRRSLEREVWRAENTIDAALRLANYVAGETPTVVDRRHLARRFENTESDRISRDAEGTFYYGAYRLRADRMDDFIRFLEVAGNSYAEILASAGGVKAATEGASEFRSAWVARSKEAAFIGAQAAFIETADYAPYLKTLQAVIDVEKRSVALQAVMWSIVVQHGPRTRLVHRALAALPREGISDEEIIRALYAERRRIELYFPKLDPTSVRLLDVRYKLEQQEALAMLEKAQKG